MPHTHHSHSGQFCNHATGSLSDILSHMVNIKNMTTIVLSEHIGRPEEHLYPDELADGWTPERLHHTFEDFIVEAHRLRKEYAVSHPEVQILIGFEGEWIDADPLSAERRIRKVLDAHEGQLDIWVGSIHHVHGEPIDYDAAGFGRALAISSHDEDRLFCAYFDAQYELLSRMKPPIVGHFDLIRLKSKHPDKNLQERQNVWPLVERNLKVIKEYGGVLEVNSSGLRKGLAQPYPCGEVITQWTSMGGHLVLSDDSHAVVQIGACYSELLQLLRDLHVHEIGVMQRTFDGRAGYTMAKEPLDTIVQHPFWDRLP